MPLHQYLGALKLTLPFSQPNLRLGLRRGCRCEPRAAWSLQPSSAGRMDVCYLVYKAIAGVVRAAGEAKANSGKAHALASKWAALGVTLQEADRRHEVGEAHRAPLQQILRLAKDTAEFLAKFAEASLFRRATKHDDDRRTFERLGFDLLAAQASLSLGLQVDAAGQQEDLRRELAAANTDDQRHLEEALAGLRAEQAAGLGEVNRHRAPRPYLTSLRPSITPLAPPSDHGSA